MQDVLSIVRINPTIKASELRPFIARHVPCHQSLDARYISNFRQKAIRHIALYGNQTVTQDEATQLLRASATEEMIAADSSIQRKQVDELLSNVMARGDIWDVIKLFGELKNKCHNFCYAIKKNTQGQPEAIMWCTAEMRRDLIRYGHSIFIDMRKTATNNIGWNYFGPAIKDCETKVRVIAECLCCVESNDMYALP